MNLLAKRENEVPAELEKVFPGVEELMRSIFGRFIEPGSGLLRSSVFNCRWESETCEKELRIRIPCPGCRSSDFQVELTGDFLHVRVHHCEEEGEEEGTEKRYLFRERSCADYEENIKLPLPVQEEGGEARYRHGVLEITLPRDLSAAPAGKQIRIITTQDKENAK